MDLNQNIDRLVKFLNDLAAAYAAECKQSNNTTYSVDFGDKWAKIVNNYGVGKSVYAFVALRDFETKNLGKVKAGDVHRPASWNAPAKHARGSVFDADYSKFCERFGVKYLRNY